jgi:uncharacterized protein with NRDE domain
MCTVTVVPHDLGVRLLCNRDERRSRIPGVPPQVHELPGQRALFPVDPQGGGTWVGVNDSGLIVALLNLRPGVERRTTAPRRSRGQIVLELLRCTSARQAMTAAAALEAELFDAFRAVIVQKGELVVATSTGEGPVGSTWQRFEAPVMFTSSSLSDAIVEPARRHLFERMVLQRPIDWLEGQARFHDHQWKHQPEISVRMERPNALTVSRTQVDVTNRTRQLLYEAPLNVHQNPGVRQCCSLH